MLKIKHLNIKICIFNIVLLIIVTVFLLKDVKYKSKPFYISERQNICGNIKYKSVYFGDESTVNNTTIVTNMFFIGTSKHSNSDYIEWLRIMIRSIGSPIVAYIDTKSEKTFVEEFQKYNKTGE